MVEDGRTRSLQVCAGCRIEEQKKKCREASAAFSSRGWFVGRRAVKVAGEYATALVAES